MLDVQLTNHLDVMMDHADQDNKIVQFYHHVILSNHLDVNQEDVVKMQLFVKKMINYYQLVQME